MARIKDVDRKLLWARSGDECAFPGCTQRLTVAPDGTENVTSSRPVVLGEEAHIVGEEDDGPRGDASVPIGERNAYPNLILLCPNHHTLIDKDHGTHFSVDQLLKMKSDHEILVESRRVGTSDQQQTFSRRRGDLLLEAASACRGRLVARWVAAGVSSATAQSLADDESVGAPSRLGQPLPETGLVVLEGEFGSGKSVTGERLHADAVSAAIDDESAPVPVHLSSMSVQGSLADCVRKAAEGLGNPNNAGLRLVLDGLDEPGPARAAELVSEARSLVLMWPNSRILATARPGLDLTQGERLTYPPLSDDEVTTLATRLGGRDSVMWSQSAAVRVMLHLPLFLIVAVLRQQAGANVPRSQGTFLEALADAALKRTHYSSEQASQALKSLARLTVGSGGAVAAAELGSDEAVRSALETRLVVRTGRALRFALPVVEQFFAAQSVLEAGLDGIDLSDMKALDRWRDSLTLAVTVGSWRQVSALVEAVITVHPGLASWLVTNAIPSMTLIVSTELPSHIECARRLHRALSEWVKALGGVGLQLGLTGSDAKLRTVGSFVEGDRVNAGLKLGDSEGVKAVQLPFGLHPFSGKAPDGSDWAPLRWGHAPADFMAWPWQWSLDWISSGLENVLRARSLPLPGNKPFEDERRWALAKAIMRRSGRFDHRPLNMTELRRTAEQLLAFMTGHNSVLYRPDQHRRSAYRRVEISGLIAAIDAGSVSQYDGMISRPYPAPDLPLGRGGHVSRVYADETLRSLVEQVYTNSLVIYGDLVKAWFPAFAPTLGLACILPVDFNGQLLPRADSWGGPDFEYQMEPLPLDAVSTANIRLTAGRADMLINWETVLEEGRRRRDLITALHPGAEGWAHPRAGSATLDVYGDTPATAQAYRWPWEDLWALHTVKEHAPVAVD